MPIFILIGILCLALAGLFTPVIRAERAAVIITGGAFLFSLSAFFLPFPEGIGYGLHWGSEAYLFAAVICFISLVIQAYSLRHFDGHRLKRRTFRYFLGLTLLLLIFTSADHLLLIAVALGGSNYLLSRLITHQPDWTASRASGRIAWLHLGLGSLLLLIATGLIYFTQGHLSLQQLGQVQMKDSWLPLIGILLIIAAMAQSAIWPLHRWLIASANAPTPVSAFMHAGLVNGGALILYKLLPLTGQLEWSGALLFILGGLTAILGTTWMLVQSDVKRTLTCSTMGQMGFMIMQCGLGLFPAAIAHMIWHGFFKASLFLSAGSTVKAAGNTSLRLHGPHAGPIFAFGLLCGIAGACLFWIFTAGSGSLSSTYLLLLIFCGITCAHAVMTILQPQPGLGRALLAAGLGLFGASVYGFSVWMVESRLAPLPAPPLNGLHLGGLAFFVAGWLLMIFRDYLPAVLLDRLIAPLYVGTLQDSQPGRSTFTLLRGRYKM